MSELQKYRDSIDEIDTQIIELLAKRFEVVKKVWEYKKKNNMPPLQASRWQEVLNSRKEQGLKLWINPDFIEKFWDDIHDYALELEKSN